MEVVGNFDNAYKLMSTVDESCLVQENRKHHIKLAPKYQGDLKSGISCQLTSFLSCYSKEFKGVPVAFKNIKVKQRLGRIIADQPCIHFEVFADFIVFKPTVGCILTGTINKVTQHHIGCLVHSCFNAWMPQSPEAKKVAITKLMGAEVQFDVHNIFTKDNVLSMKGKFRQLITKSSAEESEPSGSPIKSKKKKKGKRNAELDSNMEVDANDSVISPKVHEVTTLDTSLSISSQMEPLLSSTQMSDQGSNSDKRNKKAKKHKKDKKNIVEDIKVENARGSEVSDINTDSFSEGHKKKKKKDKGIGSNITPELTNGIAKVSEVDSEITHDNQEKSARALKKERKRKLSDQGDFPNDDKHVVHSLASNQSGDDSIADLLFSPKKKRKKEMVHVVCETVDSAIDSESKSSKSKKKKKHKKSE